MNPQVLTILSGTSGLIGLFSVIAYFYYSYRVREIQSSERSVKEIVEGEGLFNSNQIIQILHQFADDQARLDALKTFANVNNISAERVYEKIKGNVDITALEATKADQIRKISIVTGACFLIVALLAFLYALYGREPEDFRKKVLHEFEVPAAQSNQFQALSSQPDAGVVRIQPPASDPLVKAQREAVYRGGGTYYSFVKQTHEYGPGSDIAYGDGEFKVGFAGLDYGFFLYLGEREADSLTTLSQRPPAWLTPDRRLAWNYFLTYRPPTKYKEFRAEQQRSRGFAIGGANIAEQTRVIVGGLYLLRSINVDESDVLVALYIATKLNDGSVVLAYRIISQFDTPIVSDREP